MGGNKPSTRSCGFGRDAPAGPKPTAQDRAGSAVEDGPVAEDLAVMLPTQPSHHGLHLLRQEISREPHAPFLPSTETRASCWSFLGLQDSQGLRVKPSVSCLLYSHRSWTLTCAFLPASEPLCRCCCALLLHITISNIQLHLYPRRLQGKTERSLTSHCWDSRPAPSRTPEPKPPNYNPLSISFCWCPHFNWVC